MHDHHEHEHHHNHHHEHHHDHEHQHGGMAAALLHHMHEHNVHHAEELEEIISQLSGEAADKVREAVALMRQSNEKLAEAFKQM